MRDGHASGRGPRWLRRIGLTLLGLMVGCAVVYLALSAMIGLDARDRLALAAGRVGTLVLEPLSSSTRENLAFSRPLLVNAGARSVVIVSEPYPLWRIQRLVKFSGFDKGLQVQYAAAPTSCWRNRGMAFKGALREPLAVTHNFLHGYY